MYYYNDTNLGYSKDLVPNKKQSYRVQQSKITGIYEHNITSTNST